jgi:hypothetical protein
MRDLRRKLSKLLAVVGALLLATADEGVELVHLGGHFIHPLLSWVLHEEKAMEWPSPDEVKRCLREKDDVASGTEHGPIRCEWSACTGDGEHPDDLTLRLTNTSNQAITIWYRTRPHEHVTFVFRDANDRVMPSIRLGRLSSLLVTLDRAKAKPTLTLSTLTLLPGETYTAEIARRSLTNLCVDNPKKPSTHTVEAVFVYHDLGGWPESQQDFVARSGTVEIVIGEPDGDKKPSWRLHRP